jgi:5-methylcytosine-specific restriction endonuclease McrA
MDASLARDVRERAGHMCEYCRMPESNYPTVPFPIDHIIARQHGGSTTLDNLALSCLHDNTHKGPNIAGIDPVSRRISRLFNPRRDRWVRHFETMRRHRAKKPPESVVWGIESHPKYKRL